jgi:multiple sugar transport system substrate-binding protein
MTELLKWGLVIASILSPLGSNALAGPETLRISLMFSSGNQRTVFNKEIEAFRHENPGIVVESREHEQESYKSSIEKKLGSGAPDSDVVFWFAGAKLNSFVRKGWVENLDNIWRANNWGTTFTRGAQNEVKVDGKPYGLPISYYQWGIYYRKSLFTQYGLKPPRTWAELLKVGETLKRNGVTPFTLGSMHGWTVAGWFDYLDLRINGLAFHKLLMEGKVAYTDRRVKDVFLHWKDLIDQGFFIANHKDMDWRQSLPYFYRKQAAMLLMGNFVVPQIPAGVIDDIGFIRFPLIKATVPYFEEAPMDILIIPANARNKSAAKRFLEFMARADVQYDMNSSTGMISPNKTSKPGRNAFIKEGVETLNTAHGISQFFDRDTPPEMFNPGMEAMTEFMNDPGNIDQTLEKLEKIRVHAFMN